MNLIVAVTLLPDRHIGMSQGANMFRHDHVTAKVYSLLPIRLSTKPPSQPPEVEALSFQITLGDL